MKMRSGARFGLALALLGGAFGLGACSSGNGGGGGGTGGTGGGGTGGTGGGGGSGGSGGSGGGGGTTALACSTGTLFAGNPIYNGQPSDCPASGTGIHADPPLQWQNLVFSGTHLFTRDEGEVWMTDLSAASPVETLVTGHNDPTTFAFTDGACASARFAEVRGIDALADGSIVVADLSANAILHITNPTAANCAVEYWAGNNTPNSDLDIANPPDSGDLDGDGAAAKFSGPGPLVADGSGNVFVFDEGNHKIKKVGGAAPHTVTTIATLPVDGPDTLTSMVLIGNKIYAAGATGAAAFVVAVDTTTTSNNVSNVITGGGAAFPPLDPTTFPSVAGIATDGSALYIAGSGYLWKLTTTGTLSLAAGIGVFADFPPDSSYDPAASHSADTVDLETAQGEADSGSLYYLSYHDGAVYFRGQGDGTAAFVEKITCP